MKWLSSSSLCYNNFSTKTDTGGKIKYYQINWDKKPHMLRALVKKDFLINSEELQNVIVIAPFFPDFKNGNENVKTFLK